MKNPLFTESSADGQTRYTPTNEADELFIQFVAQDHIENSAQSEPYQRQAFMAGLLHLHLSHSSLLASHERLKQALEGLVANWTVLAGVAETLAAKPPSNAPLSYAASCRGQKQAYEDCVREITALSSAHSVNNG